MRNTSVILASFEEIVGERQAQSGEYASAGGALINDVTLSDLYVVATTRKHN